MSVRSAIVLLTLALSACLAFRPQLPENLERVRQRADHRWQKFGNCGDYALVRCANGHRLLTMTDGWNYSWVTAYDEHDRLEFEHEWSCTGAETWGRAIDCPADTATVERNLCQEARQQLEVAQARVEVSCGSKSREFVVDAGSNLVELVEGAVLRVDVPSGPELFEVSFDHAPDEVVVRECETDCSLLSAGQLLHAQDLRLRRGTAKSVDCSWRVRALLRSTRSDAGIASAK